MIGPDFRPPDWIGTFVPSDNSNSDIQEQQHKQEMKPGGQVRGLEGTRHDEELQ